MQVFLVNTVLIITILSLGCGKYFIVKTKDATRNNDKEKNDAGKRAVQEKGNDYQNDYDNDYQNEYEYDYENDYRNNYIKRRLRPTVTKPRRCRECYPLIQNMFSSAQRGSKSQTFQLITEEFANKNDDTAPNIMNDMGATINNSKDATIKNSMDATITNNLNVDIENKMDASINNNGNGTIINDMDINISNNMNAINKNGVQDANGLDANSEPNGKRQNWYSNEYKFYDLYSNP